MKLTTFWVVTKPTRESTLGDICFEVEPVHFIRQVKGGLDESDEPEFYTEAKEAITRANHLLSKRDRKTKDTQRCVYDKETDGVKMPYFLRCSKRANVFDPCGPDCIHYKRQGELSRKDLEFIDVSPNDMKKINKAIKV